MSTDSQEQNPIPAQNQPPVTRSINKGISRRHKAFADRYLVNGMNATEAYRYVFKPKVDESAHANAYRVMALDGVKGYIERRLLELNDASYHPEAIKSALAERAVSSKRDSDKIRSLEIMAKIQGLLTDGTAPQVNFFDGDIMALARKRLSERKKSSESQLVTNTESSEVIETKEVTTPMSYNNNYVPSVPAESVLSTNDNGTDGHTDTETDGDNGTAGEEGTPGDVGVEAPSPPLR